MIPVKSVAKNAAAASHAEKSELLIFSLYKGNGLIVL
jgi:hypothetical protein